MTSVERTEEGFVIEARLLAEVFNVTADEVREKMRDGAITSRCEAGIGIDEGRWRLTFHHGDRACRFTVDAAGTVLSRATFPVQTRAKGPTPTSARSPVKNTRTPGRSPETSRRPGITRSR